MKGFTLVETMLAIAILAVAVVGPLSIASKGLQTALVAKDETTAIYLAQDAVEYIRFKRDTNRLAGNPWLTGITGSGLCAADATVACAIDSIQDTISSATCGGGSVCTTPLNYDSINNYFSYLSGSASPYTRTVTIKTLQVDGSSNPIEVQLVVSVSWSDIAGVTHKITVNENLFSWE